MKILRLAKKVAHRLEDSALIASLLTMLVLALVQILMRNLADSGFLWAESFLRILVVWVAMLGAMVATRENNHISIDAVARYLSGRSLAWVGLLTGMFAAVICGLVAWYALEFVRFEYEDQTIAFAEVPNWVCQAILPLGFTVMALRFATTAITQIFVGDR